MSEAIKTTVDVQDQFVDRVLSHAGIALSEEQRDVYIPQFRFQLEYILGVGLFDALDDTGKKSFVRLTNTQKTTPDEWQTFWESSVPEYEKTVEQILVSFAEDVRNLAQT